MCIYCWEEYGSPTLLSDAIIEAVKSLNKLEEKHCVGGNLHVVVDDWNIEDEFLIHDDLDDEWEADTRKKLRVLALKERVSALALSQGYWNEK